jgi:hypothetical protein
LRTPACRLVRCWRRSGTGSGSSVIPLIACTTRATRGAASGNAVRRWSRFGRSCTSSYATFHDETRAASRPSSTESTNAGDGARRTREITQTWLAGRPDLNVSGGRSRRITRWERGKRLVQAAGSVSFHGSSGMGSATMADVGRVGLVGRVAGSSSPNGFKRSDGRVVGVTGSPPPHGSRGGAGGW